MSDKSSESSGEWIILNEDEDLILDNNEQSLNLELSYDAICYAVSDSIRSSFSSEELEWQYENLIPSPRPSFIQYVDPQNFDDSDDCQSEDSNVEDEVVNKCVSTSDIEEEDNVNVASITKIHSYKHNRNDRLNFILNFTLALVLASTVGLGIGHFLGWSHKCFKGTSVIHKTNDKITELPQTVMNDQKNKGYKQTLKDKSIQLLPENLLNSMSCTSLKGEDNLAGHDLCGASVNSNIAIDSELAETSIFMTSDALELKSEEEIIQNNFSNPYVLSVIPESDITKNADLNEFSGFQAVAAKIYELKEVSSTNADIDSQIEEVNNIKLELFPRNYIKEEVIDGDEALYNSKIPFSENDNLPFKSNLNKNEFDFLKEYFDEEKISNRKNNLTEQLRKDLNEVVQSLAAVTLARLSDINEKNTMSLEDSESVIKLFSDFQAVINTRITDIDNFVNSIEYKDASKFNLKYLQKMVYTLIDSVDYLMKISFKTLNREGRKINIHKFSNNISKVIFNFNKKWEKNNRFWSEASKNFKVKNFHEGSLKKGKENKYWKNKDQFEKNYKKNFKYRNSMKS